MILNKFFSVFLSIFLVLFIKSCTQIKTHCTISEEQKKELASYAVSAVKEYDLGDGVAFSTGFSAGLADIGKSTVDFTALQPFIPLYLERCIHDHQGAVTKEAGELAALQLIDNAETRYAENSVLPKENNSGYCSLAKTAQQKNQRCH